MNLLVLVLSSQLLYYLLIAQTGVVGVFDSHIHDLYTLPIGGVLGSLMSAYWRHRSIKRELYLLFAFQVLLSWIYPDYSLGTLMLLGFVVGYTTPLLLFVFSSQSKMQLALGLSISYAIGTAFYTYPYLERGAIAIILPLVSLIALSFSSLKQLESNPTETLDLRVVGMMMLWIFADSALFETLSRSGDMDIWSRYTLLIIASHLAGVYLAYRCKRDLKHQGWVIWSLFVLSYTVYYLHQPLVLSVIYPIVISYYNVLLFRTLVELKNIRLIAISMVGIGWIAASVASGVALEHQLWLSAVVLGGFALVYPFYFRRIS